MGNFFYGRSIVDKGYWGVAFTGPTTFLITGSYRFYTIIRTKLNTGRCVDKANSNWYDPETGKFKKENLIPL